MSSFRKDLEEVINRHSQENGSNTPDFVLADYLCACLVAFDNSVNAREKWYAESDRASSRPGWRGSWPTDDMNWRVPTEDYLQGASNVVK